MNAPSSTTQPTSLREWWASPPRAGLRRLISPWGYRHLRGVGLTHLACGAVATAAGFVCLSYGTYGYTALFLAVAATHLVAGRWYLTIARSGPAPA